MSKSTQAKLNAKPQEVAVLVGVQSSSTSMDIHADLDELQSLLETAGARATKRFTQNLAHPHPKYYVGKGKLEEIKAYDKIGYSYEKYKQYYSENISEIKRKRKERHELNRQKNNA